MKTIRSIFSLICLIVIGAVISVNGQTPSQPTDLSSVQPLATPTPPAQVPAIPEILKNPVLLSQILSKLQAETLRADLKTREAEDLKANRDEWKSTAALEKLRGDKLQEAENSRGQEAGALRASVGFLQTSVSEYKTEVSDLRRENDKLRSSRKWYMATGAALGVAAGFYIRR